MKTLLILLTAGLCSGCGDTLQRFGNAYRAGVHSQSFNVTVDGVTKRVEAGSTIYFRDPAGGTDKVSVAVASPTPTPQASPSGDADPKG